MSHRRWIPDFQERVAQVRAGLAERLLAFHPGPRVYATAFCVGATIGEYAALAGSTNPTAVIAAISALSAQLGVNLLADIIGDRELPSGLTPEEIACAVQERLEQGGDLPAVRTLLQEFGTLELALDTWREGEDRCRQQLVDELSRHPQLIAIQVTQDVVATLNPRLITLEQRTQRILELLEASRLGPRPPLDRVLRVFIGPTGEDLIEYRKSAYEAIEGYYLCVQNVMECDLFVGIVGHLYGSISGSADQSDTEHQYQVALDAGKHRLMFLSPEDFPNLDKPEPKRV